MATEEATKAKRIDFSKYKIVRSPKEQAPEDEIRVSAQGRVSSYVSYAATRFAEGKREIKIKATGNALNKAVQQVEILKRRIKGLHQINKIYSQEIIDEYEPIDKDSELENVTDTKNVSVMLITLSLDQLDEKDCGYQAPLPEDQVEDIDPEEISRPRRKGKGKGNDDDEEADEGEDDVAKSKKKPRKRKGKGKGKKDDDEDDEEDDEDEDDDDDEYYGKGKKGKGKGSAEWDDDDEDDDDNFGGGGGAGVDGGAGVADTAPASKRGKGKKGKGKGKGKRRGKGGADWDDDDDGGGGDFGGGGGGDDGDGAPAGKQRAKLSKREQREARANEVLGNARFDKPDKSESAGPGGGESSSSDED